ncbi:LOW QUALITY PROTEIN: probable glycosyltransferase At5g25310 [Morus notabilis]|nr:LOW QUALITY PROTEIN: probable glycosyltransferase At5g25310 [Morus notabilis]
MVYHNPGAFYQSYREMEKRFKVYVYSEGELPIAHDGPCKNLYAIEGRFIHEMEQGPGKFRTKDGESAHVYFMPFSVTWMVKYLYNPNSNFDKNPLRRYVADYVNLVSNRYPFWNRTNGADHFMVACHDWAPQATEGNPLVYNTSIRVLCNANTTEGFNPEKDVSLPEIHLLTGDIPNELVTPPPLDGPPPYRGLGFFAGGGDHGPIRPVLLKHWKGRDEELQVHEYLPKNMSYHSFMLNSKFCLCPSGYEVASPRVVEAIYAECVPVIMSENYVLPFSDVLNWDAFSIKVEVSDIPRLKEILSAVWEEKYRKLKEGLQVVRKHFVLNQPAQRFDVFHMILHSIWLRRINFGVVHNVA